MLCDTGAFCNCVSLQYYKTCLARTTSLTPHRKYQNFTSANNSVLDVVGSVKLNIKLGGRFISAVFHVIDKLSQDVILGVEFMERTGALLDYRYKQMSLFDGSVSVPLLTSIDLTRAVKTIKRIRIPAQHEVILPARIPRLPDNTLGITETLPHTSEKGLKVASALVDCGQNISLCRVANPTNRPVLWPAGHAFAYLSTLPADDVGVNLIDVSECFNDTNGDENDKRDIHDSNADNVADTREENTDTTSGVGDHEMPSHEERLRILHDLGVKIGDDVLNKEQSERLSKLLYEYRDIMALNYMQVPEARVPRHTIPLIDDKPSIQKRFRYDPVKEQKLEDLCDELLEAGIIKESNSLWCSPVFLVTKPDGSSRFLVDFRAVNAKTAPLFCALPSLEDVFDQVSEEKPTVFSVLDLRAGYYGIGLDEASQPYTAFSTKNRHFHFARLNMGYVNSGSFFTQSLYKIFADEVRKNMIIYVDDIFIMHRDVNEHLEFLRKIFAKFREYNLRLHPKKMNIATSSANFLGYTLKQGGYTVDTGRCKIVKNYPRPKNARDTKRFLGIATYFKRLIRKFSIRSAPLRGLIAKDAPFEWTDAHERSFCDIRDTLCSAPVLGYPDRNKPLRVVLDASSSGLAYLLLNVNEDGTETALFYGGRSTTRAERNYSATDLELAALLAAVKTFWSYLANTTFEIVTDHISLTYIQNLRFGPSKLVRASLLLSQFNYKVTHLAGRQNSAADSISRTIDLQTDPLTAHEANRFQADEATDLRLDYTTAEDSARDSAHNTNSGTKTQHDVGIQCDMHDTARADLDAESSETANFTSHAGENSSPTDSACHAPRQHDCHLPRAAKSQRTDASGASTEAVTAPATSKIQGKARERTAGSNTRDSPSSSGGDGAVSDNCKPVPGTTAACLGCCPRHPARNEPSDGPMPTTNEVQPDVLNDVTVQHITAGDDDGNSIADDDKDRNANSTPSYDDDITLQTQHTDTKLAHIIDYLQRGKLPDDDKLARRVVLTSDQFVIRDDKLFHLGIRRQKNNNAEQPIAEQICVPRHLQSTLLARYHAQLMHCGYEKMYLSMRQRVYWDDMYTQVREYVAQCDTCHTSKANNHPTKVKIRCRDVPPQIFQRVHLDHLKISVKGATHGYTHALIMIDAMSLCCEIVPVKSTSAAETCRVLLREWIAKYGVFSELVTDRHKAFTGKLTQLLLEWCGIRHILISPYHSQSNGQAERMNSMVLQGLRVHCRGLTEWHKMLAPIAAAYKASVVPSRGVSPFKLLFGVDMRLPVETTLAKDLPAHRRPTENIELMAKQMNTMRTQAQSLAQESRERGAKTANKRRQPCEFKPGDRVYKVRDALGDADDRKTASRFQGPYVVLERGNNDVYKLGNFYTGKTMKNFIHADKLKNCQSMRAAKNKRPAITTITKHNKHASSKRNEGRIASRSRATCGADNAQCAGGFRGVHPDSSGGRCTDCPQRTGEGDSDNRTYESTCKHGGDESTPADSPSTASCVARRAAVLETQLTMRHGDAEIEPHFDRGPPREYKNAHDDSDSNETHPNGRGTPRFRYIYGRPTRTGQVAKGQRQRQTALDLAGVRH